MVSINRARELLRKYPALQHGRAIWLDQLERERSPRRAEMLRGRLAEDERLLSGMREAIKKLDPIEQRIITQRYFSHKNIRCTPWRSVFMTVYGADDQAHQRAGFRAHRAALDKLDGAFESAGLY